MKLSIGLRQRAAAWVLSVSMMGSTDRGLSILGLPDQPNLPAAAVRGSADFYTSPQIG